MGDNAAISLTTDLDGLPRIVDGDWDGTATVDMGAYEYQPPCPSGSRLFVDKHASGSDSGESWDDAFLNLHTALAAAATRSAIDEIWVASGVYTPGATITATFALVAGVGVYGGFAGGELRAPSATRRPTSRCSAATSAATMTRMPTAW